MIHQARGTGEVYYSNDYPAPWARSYRHLAPFYRYEAPCARSCARHPLAFHG